MQTFLDETGFHSDLPDLFDSEIIVKADFVEISSVDPCTLIHHPVYFKNKQYSIQKEFCFTKLL